MVFDPNAAAQADAGIFGLETTYDEAALVFIPVPWEATTSFGGGTSGGPQAILKASHQVDLFHKDITRPYEAGFFLLPEPKSVKKWNTRAKKEAQKIIKRAGHIGKDKKLKASLKEVNSLSEKLNHYVLAESRKHLNHQKSIAIIGGDHSVPFGALQAIAEQHKEYGILHFDAHSDTRVAFEGFEWSHASIMHNVLERIAQVKKLVQVGIRDFCEEEFTYCNELQGRVEVFYDADLARLQFEGVSWKSLTEKMINPLPEKVWISFDIDGLDPRLCPHTGTPVPGGLDFNQAVYVLSSLVKTGRKIIGFDLNEVAPSKKLEGSWDANVGARLLYQLASLMAASQGWVQWKK